MSARYHVAQRVGRELSCSLLRTVQVIHRIVSGDAGFVAKRTAKGADKLYVNPATAKEVWVTVHGHDAGKLGTRNLRDAGVM